MDSNLIKIQAAFERRVPFIKELGEQKTNCFRAFGGKLEGVEGLTIDIFDGAAVLNAYEGRMNLAPEELNPVCSLVKKLYDVDKTIVKKFVMDRSKSVMQSNEDPEAMEALENGLKFEIHLNDGLSVGLFLDQRENRKVIKELSRNKRVLNLFSYTCGFSVYAASIGAKTVSVDVSKKYLEWGKRNFALNGLSLEGHAFIKEDVPAYLRRCEKRGETFDVIVLDPPSFGRSGNKVFSVEKDLGGLLDTAVSVLKEGGVLLVSTNFQKIKSTQLRSLVKESLGNGNFTSKELATRVPFDFEKEENPLSAILIQAIKR